MKEMIKELVSVFKEDPKEFTKTFMFGLFIFGVMWFLFWFGNTFMYDM